MRYSTLRVVTGCLICWLGLLEASVDFEADSVSSQDAFNYKEKYRYVQCAPGDDYAVDIRRWVQKNEKLIRNTLDNSPLSPVADSVDLTTVYDYGWKAFNQLDDVSSRRGFIVDYRFTSLKELGSGQALSIVADVCLDRISGVQLADKARLPQLRIFKASEDTFSEEELTEFRYDFQTRMDFIKCKDGSVVGLEDWPVRNRWRIVSVLKRGGYHDYLDDKNENLAAPISYGFYEQNGALLVAYTFAMQDPIDSSDLSHFGISAIVDPCLGDVLIAYGHRT